MTDKIILCYNDEFVSQMFAEPDGPVMADSSLLYEAATVFHDHITKALTDAGVDWEWADGQHRGYHGWNGSRHPVQGIWGAWKSWTYVSDEVKALVDGAAIKAQEAGQACLNEGYRRIALDEENYSKAMACARERRNFDVAAAASTIAIAVAAYEEELA